MFYYLSSFITTAVMILEGYQTYYVNQHYSLLLTALIS